MGDLGCVVKIDRKCVRFTPVKVLVIIHELKMSSNSQGVLPLKGVLG